jgi:protein involved in polysaccharide export with SLBB domain
MTATVRGEVLRPGTYTVDPGDRVSSLVERAGGFTDAAFLRGAALTRRGVADAQREELRAILEKIAAETRPADDPLERRERERFLAAVEGLSPEGRIPVRLSHPRLMKGTADDIPLADGDSLTVPKDSGTVAVKGAVKSPGEFPARDDAGYRDFVRAAGGVTGDADTKKAWLLAADGTAAPLARAFVAWNPVDARWEFTAFRGDPAPVRAGDTVVVPRKAGRIAWFKGIPDIEALLVRIAVIAGRAVVP